MDNATLQRVKELLERNDNLGIVVGKNHSLDDMAAALSLCLSLSQTGKKVTVACPTDPLVAVSSLVGVDTVKKTLGGNGGDLVVSFPYKEGEIEKVSYTIEEGNLNIVVKAGEHGLTFSESDVQFKRGVKGVPTLLFVVGTPRLSDLETLFNPEELKDVTVVNIDNKPENQGFGDVVLVSSKFSSVSEQVASLLLSLDDKLDADIAQNLFSGISSATEDFQKDNTSYLAFEMAGVLLRKGATRIRGAAQTLSRDPFFEPVSPAFPQKQSQQPIREPQGRQGQFQQRGFQGQQVSQQPSSYGQAQQQSKFRQDKKQQQSTGQPRSTGSSSSLQAGSVQPQQSTKTPPDDWLTPKIYKGSTEI